MKKLFVLALLLTLAFKAFSQAFEGEIVYANSYKSKMPNLNDAQLGAMMGTTQEYYIKGGNYKSVFNGSFFKMQLYVNSDNKSYELTAKSDTLYWEDFGQNKDVAIRYELKPNSDTIMGVPCDLLIVYTAKSKTLYYYSSKYGVNPDLYKNHAYQNWYYIISKTKALPLKTVFEDDQVAFTSTAVSVKAMTLDGGLFEVGDKGKVARATW